MTPKERKQFLAKLDALKESFDLYVQGDMKWKNEITARIDKQDEMMKPLLAAMDLAKLGGKAAVGCIGILAAIGTVILAINKITHPQ